MQSTLERGTVSLPADLSNALRNRLRETQGPEVASMPLGMLLRYVAAIVAGIPDAQARRYARALPRGNTHNRNYPTVRELTRQ